MRRSVLLLVGVVLAAGCASPAEVNPVAVHQEDTQQQQMVAIQEFCDEQLRLALLQPRPEKPITMWRRCVDSRLRGLLFPIHWPALRLVVEQMLDDRMVLAEEVDAGRLSLAEWERRDEAIGRRFSNGLAVLREDLSKESSAVRREMSRDAAILQLLQPQRRRR